MSQDMKKIQDILQKAEEYAKKKDEKGSKRYLTSGAFWVRPDGKVRAVKNGGYHINDIISHPEVFGYTKDEIQALYDQYGERLGQEGEARDSLMTNVLKEGWVRIRVRRNFYSIQVWDFNPATYNRLENFVSHAIEDGIDGEYANENDEAKVNALKTGKLKSLNFGEILKGFLYESEQTDIDYTYFTR